MFLKKKMTMLLGSMFMATALMSSPVFADEKLVTADVNTYANIRSEGSMSGSIIGSFAKGETAEVVSTGDSWTQIRTEDGVVGYVYSDLLKSTSEAAEESSEDTSSSSSYTRYNATAEEVNLLGAIIQCEAGGESYEGKVAVGAVVLNRVDSSSFPSTISDVIYQSGQFTPASSGSLSSVLSSGVRSDCIEAAKAALNGENPVEGCLYFRSGKRSGIVIGNQTFR